MLKSFRVGLVACGVLIAMSETVFSQESATTPYTSPRVSPYLNLGVNASGLSTYPTLVRPMIDDQDAIARQSAEIDRLERQLRSGRGAQNRGAASRDSKGTGGGPARFMNYSHYFSAGARDSELRTANRLR